MDNGRARSIQWTKVQIPRRYILWEGSAANGHDSKIRQCCSSACRDWLIRLAVVEGFRKSMYAQYHHPQDQQAFAPSGMFYRSQLRGTSLTLHCKVSNPYVN